MKNSYQYLAYNRLTGLFFVLGLGFTGTRYDATPLDSVALALVRFSYSNVVQEVAS